MALLIVVLDKHIGNARAWCGAFGEQLPDLEIRIWPDAGNLALRPKQEIHVVVMAGLDPAIHAPRRHRVSVDARIKSGHDGWWLP
jgi:hypothetical protein